MVKVKDILDALEAYAPPAMKMDFDNVGFLVGFAENPVSRLLVSLDITDAVVDEAVEWEAQLIVSHHPLFFSLKAVTDTDRTGRKIATLLKNNISAICMHTNLDAASGGVNDALAEAADLSQTTILCREAFDESGVPYSYGRVGFLPAPVKLDTYLETLKNNLNTRGLRYHDAGRDVYKVAVVGGSGGSYVSQALQCGCDTLVTADIKYDVFLEAKELGLNIIDGDHFCTENVVTPKLAEKIKGHFPDLDVRISKRHAQTAQFYC